MRRRLLTLGPDNEPLWVRLFVHQYENHWAAMLVGDDVRPRDPGTVTGLAFFGAAPEEAEQEAKAYLGHSEPMNRPRVCHRASVGASPERTARDPTDATEPCLLQRVASRVGMRVSPRWPEEPGGDGGHGGDDFPSFSVQLPSVYPNQ